MHRAAQPAASPIASSSLPRENRMPSGKEPAVVRQDPRSARGETSHGTGGEAGDDGSRRAPAPAPRPDRVRARRQHSLLGRRPQVEALSDPAADRGNEQGLSIPPDLTATRTGPRYLSGTCRRRARPASARLSRGRRLCVYETGRRQPTGRCREETTNRWKRSHRRRARSGTYGHSARSGAARMTHRRR